MKVLAFDFGASSGRAIIGGLENGKLTLEEVHRFDNEPVYINGGFHWDLPRLFHEIKQGLVKAEKYGYESIGIDTWGVDFGLLTKGGYLLGDPYHYRDERTAPVLEAVRKQIGDGPLYRQTGIQTLAFNSVYQLLATKKNDPDVYSVADKMVLMPDLFSYLLCGEVVAERSIASTTQMLDPETKEWNLPFLKEVGIDPAILPRLVDSGERIAMMKKDICDELGITPKWITAVCGHDTQSAIVAVPAKDKDFVYISCGTWSLFGTEMDAPCVSDMAVEMDVSNETGYGRTTDFLRNIIGLWMIQETRRQFRRDGKEYSYAEMEALAREAKPMQCFIDPDEPRFSPPGNQVQRIRDFCRETGQYVPETDGEIIRCIYESLAMKYAYTFKNLKKCTGKPFSAIHMVGGGTKDGFLCQMTADATGVPVIAGPIEATAAGNIAVQLISAGEIKDLAEARAIIADSFSVVEYKPQDSGFNENYDTFCKIVK